MNALSNNNAAANNPAADEEIFDVPVAAIHAGRSSRSNRGWSKVKKVLPDVVAVRSSFQGKMAVSGSRQKEQFAKRGSDVPPADPGDLEKNFDSVSTLGAPFTSLAAFVVTSTFFVARPRSRPRDFST